MPPVPPNASSIVSCANEEEHLQHLAEVCRRLEEYGLVVNAQAKSLHALWQRSAYANQDA